MRRPLPILALLPLALSLLTGGCESRVHSAPARPLALFENVAAERGLTFRWGHGGRSPLNIRETLGGGVGFIDYDGDGWLDVILAGTTHDQTEGRLALFHNEHGRFRDVTAGSGLESAREEWEGLTVGDYDRDGRPDLFLAAFGGGRLFRNAGDGRFRDVTAPAGLARRPANEWQTSPAFADVNNDGWLDLYVANYVIYDPAKPLCVKDGIKTSCGPNDYLPQRGVLYLNRQGRYEDVTRVWGVHTHHGKGLGTAFADADDDGRVDLYVANDEMEGDLFANRGGRFENVGTSSGTSLHAMGKTQAGMGVDWGDYDGDGRVDLFVTVYERETNSLYRNEQPFLFSNVGDAVGASQSSLPYVGFGTRFIDFDNDGWLDIVVMNGHAQDNIEQIRAESRYRQPALVMRNEKGELFTDWSAKAGPALTEPIVGRGLATGDFDNDGRVDMLVSDIEGAVRLLHNRAPTRSWLTVKLVGTRSNPEAIGAHVTAEVSGRKLVRQVVGGGSFFAASDYRVHYGLDGADRVDRLTIRWPSGEVTTRANIAANTIITIRENEQ